VKRKNFKLEILFNKDKQKPDFAIRVIK